jgi:hypothetical protein
VATARNSPRGLASGAAGTGSGGRITTSSTLLGLGGRVAEGGGSTGAHRERTITVSRPRIEPAEIEGSLDLTRVSETIRRGNGAIKACYVRGLKHNPTLGGTLRVRITVAGAGTVRNVSVRGTTLADTGVAACAAKAIRGWRFPASVDGRGGAVEPTWVLKAGQ